MNLKRESRQPNIGYSLFEPDYLDTKMRRSMVNQKLLMQYLKPENSIDKSVNNNISPLVYNRNT